MHSTYTNMFQVNFRLSMIREESWGLMSWTSAWVGGLGHSGRRKGWAAALGGYAPALSARSLDGKFTRTHEGHQIGSESDINAWMFRISQTLDLEIPRSSATAIEVEQYVEHPSAASFPENDVEIPSYHYHLGRRRIISLSSPELGEEMTSDATWRSRIWAWGKSYRRRR